MRSAHPAFQADITRGVMPRTAAGLLVTFVLAGLLGAGSVRAQDPGDLVVLLHPSIEGWSAAVATHLRTRPVDAVLAMDTGPGQFHTARMRLEVGDSPGRAQGWVYLLQVGPAKPAPQPHVAGAAGATGVNLVVPYALHYRSTAKGGRVQLAKGALHCFGRDRNNAGEAFARSFANGDLTYDVSQALTPQVAVDSTTYTHGFNRPAAMVPVVKSADGNSVSIHLQNRLRATVRVRITQMWPEPERRPKDYLVANEALVCVLAPGEKHDIDIPVSALKGIDVRWTALQVTVVDVDLARQE